MKQGLSGTYPPVQPLQFYKYESAKSL